ncbi:four helix bundle protein [Natronospira bacteriovora]|uniref:Four helix bundle protein n=1 Tax=Natronospira bacteriovora TaxID=3069753 RepID=A0ABU0W768_9GAMM|nr:four helix bundle protein [Natronospira sp. AB-CW4]MDQ2069877.1 four helix bundle protein [Natronospira sp. AB-CW4]
MHAFGHEKLDVYQLSLQYVAWASTYCQGVNGLHRHARGQLLRASQSVPMNIAEGNGKGTQKDRRRFFEIARGSALECAAIQDVLVVTDAMDAAQSAEGKAMLVRIVSMLTRLGAKSLMAREASGEYALVDNDNDNDNDNEVTPSTVRHRLQAGSAELKP